MIILDPPDVSSRLQSIAIDFFKPEDDPGWLDVAGEQVDPKIGLVLKSKLVFFQTM